MLIALPCSLYIIALDELSARGRRPCSLRVSALQTPPTQFLVKVEGNSESWATALPRRLKVVFAVADAVLSTHWYGAARLGWQHGLPAQNFHRQVQA